MRRFAYRLAAGIAFGIFVLLAASTYTIAAAPPLLAQSEEPAETQPPTTPERVDEDPVVHEGTKMIYALVALLIAGGVVGLLIWSFRTGRKNPPATGKKKNSSGGD